MAKKAPNQTLPLQPFQLAFGHQMQLFENFYPMQQPPSQQPQDFGLQPAGPLGQPHLAHHSMAPYPFPPNPDLNPELRKALLQDSHHLAPWGSLILKLWDSRWS
ncbi:hypothetical protein CB1_000743107 [Camelus ferus]|nr:hypothetical protein CB1_000743107 [Camelus ferus]